MSVFIGYPSFMAYQMMKGKKGNNDGFPSIPGMIARYSALGLTNEQMAANPVWVDKTGNGHDLQMKNFAWGGMFGVGSVSTYYDKYEFTPDKYYMVAVSSGTQHAQFTFKVTGLVDGNTLSLADASSPRNLYGKWTQDGIYTVDIDVINTDKSIYFYNGISATRGEFTIEILPLYPGFILGDGVDDFAVTEKELNFKDTYTVYTAFIPFQNNPTRNMILCGADSKKTFSMQYPALVYVSFIAGNNYYINADFVNGLNLFVCKRNGNNICIKNLLTNKVVTGTCGDWVENAGLYYLWKNATYASFARAAIAGQTICNGYFSTDKDDEKVLDWYKKQYPWLFPDQAWTVVGKTNEDEDRATIANITGNGNDLILSNFAFSGNSGYGSYPFGMNVWNPDYIADQPYGTVHYPNDLKSYATTVKNNATNFRIKFRLRGLPEGGSFLIQVFDMNDLNTVLKTYTYTENGIHEFVYNDPNKPARIILYNGNTNSNISEFYLDIIPEYEGYLVTDGVDDKIVSAESIAFTDTWTIITDTVFLGKVSVASGILASNIFTVYNYQGSGTIAVAMGEGGRSLRVITSSIKAFSSDGTIYDAEWNEYHVEIGTIRALERLLKIGTSSNEKSYFCQLAFKFLGIYNNQILSKDDCIKAYNYLQTLKVK